MTRTIELPDELISDIIVESLTADYHRVCGEIDRLKDMRPLQPYQAEDLAASRKVKKAAKRMLAYYGVDL